MNKLIVPKKLLMNFVLLILDIAYNLEKGIIEKQLILEEFLVQ
ncbi:hypothetical protein [Clostridium estertheticum]|nr:hypothetical protein [Clostridium estertheticum]